MEHSSGSLLSIRTEEVDIETGAPTIGHNLSVYEDLSRRCWVVVRLGGAS